MNVKNWSELLLLPSPLLINIQEGLCSAANDDHEYFIAMPAEPPRPPSAMLNGPCYFTTLICLTRLGWPPLLQPLGCWQFLVIIGVMLLPTCFSFFEDNIRVFLFTKEGITGSEVQQPSGCLIADGNWCSLSAERSWRMSLHLLPILSFYCIYFRCFNGHITGPESCLDLNFVPHWWDRTSLHAMIYQLHFPVWFGPSPLTTYPRNHISVHPLSVWGS